MVRQRSAKPLLPSSNLGVASKVETLSTLNLVGLEFFYYVENISERDIDGITK